MPLQLNIPKTWKFALLGGLLAFPFTAFEAWQSPENIMLEMVLVGSALAGYFVKRHGGNSTATGVRAALVGGLPSLWVLGELLLTIPTISNPLWFGVVSVAMVLVLGVVLMGIVAVFGGLAGRFGGWLAERRGHGGSANALSSP
ncbi:DUF5518 domain-containing protein [Haloarcula onubensis]|uniref:DUF5518 domain-containing protein n=1 Tax=Haloarcula onubensis TaxID=2950539 RepID=A0ABU2FUR8_9EURY|nr:DUF5518 domain-containing protein [Halomicroarcula sp. S3CR25-11]MDS0284515.1 DUF5518 domain-containing protein [Halomicroarcula sp. S3CR25-11]